MALQPWEAVANGVRFRSDSPRWAAPVTGINGPVKRAMDVIISALALIFLLPLLASIALLVRLDSRGPVLFRQNRVGRDGALFAMLKFRTMHVDAPDRLGEILASDPQAAEEWRIYQKLTRDPRVTRIGRFLRRSSLDELPQFINVLLGHMSIVGQRPILPEQREAYGAHINAYLSARPGITGLWQVSGRNATSFHRRAELGTAYLGCWSLLSDIAILARTPLALLASRTS